MPLPTDWRLRAEGKQLRVEALADKRARSEQPSGDAQAATNGPSVHELRLRLERVFRAFQAAVNAAKSAEEREPARTELGELVVPLSSPSQSGRVEELRLRVEELRVGIRSKLGQQLRVHVALTLRKQVAELQSALQSTRRGMEEAQASIAQATLPSAPS